MIYGSMALEADGWHMSTHAGALAISWVAYVVAWQCRHDQRFALGAGIGSCRFRGVSGNSYRL